MLPAELGSDKLHVWINGELVPAAEAKVSVFDRGLMYGDGVYEGLRVLEGRMIFRLGDHLKRLQGSAKTVAITIPYSMDELKAGLGQVVQASGLVEGHMRVIVTRGVSEPGLDPRRATASTVIIMGYPFSARIRPGAADSGMRGKLAAVRRFPPQVLDPKVKNLNYLNEIMAQLEANAAGADTAIMLGMDGFLAEATAANMFLVRDDSLFTPYPNHCLAGITRATIMDLAREQGIPVAERDLTITDLLTADEAFLVSTAVDVAPLVEVDGRLIGTGKGGPMTESFRKLFGARMMESSTPLF